MPVTRCLFGLFTVFGATLVALMIAKDRMGMGPNRYVGEEILYFLASTLIPNRLFSPTACWLGRNLRALAAGGPFERPQ